MLKIFDKKYSGYLPTLMKEIESSDYYDEEAGIFEYKAFLENHFKVWLMCRDYVMYVRCTIFVIF